MKKQERGVQAGQKEYPLYGHYALCPTARYIGGVSRYLCECRAKAGAVA